MRRIAVAVIVLLAVTAGVRAAEPNFQVGFAKRDITPTAPMPMWGYGAATTRCRKGCWSR